MITRDFWSLIKNLMTSASTAQPPGAISKTEVVLYQCWAKKWDATRSTTCANIVDYNLQQLSEVERIIIMIFYDNNSSVTEVIHIHSLTQRAWGTWQFAEWINWTMNYLHVTCNSNSVDKKTSNWISIVDLSVCRKQSDEDSSDLLKGGLFGIFFTV